MCCLNDVIADLENNKIVQIRPEGESMRGRIESLQLVTLVPAKYVDVKVDDIVLVKWKKHYILHLIKEKRNMEILVGNNHGKSNGWVPADSILAKVIKVED